MWHALYRTGAIGAGAPGLGRRGPVRRRRNGHPRPGSFPCAGAVGHRPARPISGWRPGGTISLPGSCQVAAAARSPAAGGRQPWGARRRAGQPWAPRAAPTALALARRSWGGQRW